MSAVTDPLVPEEQLSEDLAAVADLVAAGVEVDGEAHVTDTTWVVYGHSAYDGEIVVGVYGTEVEAIEVVHRAPHPGLEPHPAPGLESHPAPEPGLEPGPLPPLGDEGGAR